MLEIGKRTCDKSPLTLVRSSGRAAAHGQWARGSPCAAARPPIFSLQFHLFPDFSQFEPNGL